MLLRLAMYLAPLAGLLGLYAAGRMLAAVRSESLGNDDKARLFLSAVTDGATAFLGREFRVLAVFAAAVFVLLTISIGLSTGIAFLFGAGCSMLVGYRGMSAAADSAVRTREASRSSGSLQALPIALDGGAAAGLTVASLGLVGIGALYWFWGDTSGAGVINGFALGASSVALMARLDGGVYARAIDIGSGLASRLHVAGSECDPAAKGVIAGSLADVVGEVTGMGADLFDSYCASIIATVAIAATMGKIQLLTLGDGSVEAETLQSQLMMYPLVMAVIGLVTSLLGIYAIGWLKGQRRQTALRYAAPIAGVVFLLAALIVTAACSVSHLVWWAVAVGTGGGVAFGVIAGHYASGTPFRRVADSSTTAATTDQVFGMSVGLESCALPVLTICACILIANGVAGLYGIGIAAVGMLATVGVTMAVYASGQIAGNACENSGTAELGPQDREGSGDFGAFGNTTAVIGRSLAIGCAAVTALALFSAYAMAVNMERIRQGQASMQILVTDPKVLIGLFVGGMVPFFVAALGVATVDRGTMPMADGVCPQPRPFCEVPVLVAIVSPLIVGVLLGPEALGGMLAGATLCGVLLALVMANAAGPWDKAGKAIEKGEMEGETRVSRSRFTVVAGDTVGVPFNNSSGPSMNILIKLMSIVSLVIAPLLA